ncbi:hypothetical protein AJ79_03315 [Helicocarpus griseus UAMH5409]|uniref:AB hydrolase-1 domain-containing protein n=1 Tax=Helicocarpus griseus UAMH5409 TaxID=1447875 RepID=A0A2B7XYM4_9EURO|nr:hypothetical protein AJ79_03315 [Helicocarpus griseus UAMH5409]
METRGYQNVKFRALDGVYLRGRLYPAAQKGPAVILSPGYNATVDNFPPGVPEEFQKANITALVFDPRNTGKSGGFPRNDVDPFKQVEDYSDAFCYLSTLNIVDSKAIIFWGISLSAGIALSAAAVDKRIAAVIAIAPIFKFLPVTAADSKRLKTKLMKDRESQILHKNPPYILPIAESLAQIPFNSHLNANRDDDNGRMHKEVEEQQSQDEPWKAGAGEDDDENVFNASLTHNNYGTTMQSYHHMFLFEPVPEAMSHEVYPTPVMFMTPEQDQISPPEKQTAVFNSLRGVKRQCIAPGKEHVWVLNGSDMPILLKPQTDFIWEVVRGDLNISNGG